jgi:hypothetical protein
MQLCRRNSARCAVQTRNLSLQPHLGDFASGASTYRQWRPWISPPMRAGGALAERKAVGRDVDGAASSVCNFLHAAQTSDGQAAFGANLLPSRGYVLHSHDGAADFWIRAAHAFSPSCPESSSCVCRVRILHRAQVVVGGTRRRSCQTNRPRRRCWSQAAWFTVCCRR